MILFNAFFSFPLITMGITLETTLVRGYTGTQPQFRKHQLCMPRYVPCQYIPATQSRGFFSLHTALSLVSVRW